MHSSDDTPDRLARLARDDARVRLERLDRGVGAAAARNRGIAASSGVWVAFSDDDCIWVPEKLERQLASVGPTDVAGFSPVLVVGRDGGESTIGTLPPGADGFEDALFKHGLPGPFAFLIRRDALLRAGGFDEALPRLQDFDLWLRLWGLGGFAYVPEPLVTTRWLAGGISTRTDALVRAGEILRGKYAREPGMNRHRRSLVLRGVAHTLMCEGAYAPAVASLARSLGLEPSWRGLASLVCGLAGPRVYLAAAAHAAPRRAEA